MGRQVRTQSRSDLPDRPGLLQLLDRTFRFWRQVTSRMRSFGRYFWDPQLVSGRVSPLAELVALTSTICGSG